MVAEHEHRRRSRRLRGRRATATCSAGAHRRRGPGRWCRAPRASRRSSPPRRACPRSRAGIGHRVVVAPHVVQPRRRRLRKRSRNASYCSRRPRSVRSPLTTTASGSSAAISATAPRPITRDTADHRARAQDRADGVVRRVAGAPAFGLAEVHVVRGGDGRDQLARRAAPACARVGGSQRSGATPLDRELVLGVGREAVDVRDVVRARRCVTSWSPTEWSSRARRSLVNVTTTSSVPTLMSSAFAGPSAIRRSPVRRGVRRPMRPGESPRPPLQARPARTAAAAARTHSCSVSSASGSCGRARGRTASAATIAATSSGDRVGCDRVGGGPAVAYSGTLPCLRDGSCSRFVRSIASDRASTRRVSRGSMTSST